MTPRVRIRVIACAAVVAAGAGAAIVVEDQSTSAPTAPTASSRVPVFHMQTDHATYAEPIELDAEADLIAVGTVLSQATEPGVSPGVDGAGDPLPAIPHTNYQVAIERVVKGSASVGDTIVVSLSGGATPNGSFVLDGGPILAQGTAQLFFLDAGSDGRYYPLAGGAAVAARQPDGTYALSGEVTGGSPISLAGDATPADPPSPSVERGQAPPATGGRTPDADGIPPRAQLASLRVGRTKGKGKRARARVVVRFRGSDAATLSSRLRLLCKLDKGKPSGCRSPAVYRVKPGKHKFSLTVVDLAGNKRTVSRSFAVRKARRSP